ncbi:hypothetical protein BDZ85DRAFT_255747 [Elsinoe ampelina]|uniref:Uncharacterized protein n=1 Tax=Elsinoe ampelina TaxID=302913 RepID=A0A6A6GRE7_9PEZI|nr:hypothetical protein BDZ85DRAFT_255747 [Elsinoe ampelina]
MASNNAMPSISAEPESHAAKNFGADLDAVFGIDKPLAELSKKVQEKKKEVDNQASELAAIENRLKEAEAKLAQVTGSAPPTPAKSSSQSRNEPNYAHTTTAQSRPAIPPNDASANFSRPQPQETVPRKPMNSRQDSLGLPPIPGAMPVTPAETRGSEYMASGSAR